MAPTAVVARGVVRGVARATGRRRMRAGKSVVNMLVFKGQAARSLGFVRLDERRRIPFGNILWPWKVIEDSSLYMVLHSLARRLSSFGWRFR